MTTVSVYNTQGALTFGTTVLNVGHVLVASEKM